MAVNQLLYGIGKPDMFELIKGKFLKLEPLTFELSGNANKVQSRKQVNGLTVVAGSKLVSEEYTVRLTVEAASWTALQIVFGEVAGISTAIPIPEVRSAKVDATNFDITDPDVATSADVWVFDAANDVSLSKRTASGNPTAGEFKIDVPNGKILLNSARAGQTLEYRVIKTYSTINSIGREDIYDALTSFSFSGIAKGDVRDYRIVIPKLERVNTPSLNLSSGNAASFDLEYDALVPPGQRKAFQLYELP